MDRVDEMKTNQLATKASNDIREEIERNEINSQKNSTAADPGPSSSSSSSSSSMSNSAPPQTAPKFIYKRQSLPIVDELLNDEWFDRDEQEELCHSKKNGAKDDNQENYFESDNDDSNNCKTRNPFESDGDNDDDFT